jgi:hypothetical protein
VALVGEESVSGVTGGSSPGVNQENPPMRIYIIGDDGITELHAARLSGKRLLALWNALPDVEKRQKVGDRNALIDQLWSAIEMLPEPQSDAKRPSKQDAVITMSREP